VKSAVVTWYGPPPKKGEIERRGASGIHFREKKTHSVLPSRQGSEKGEKKKNRVCLKRPDLEKGLY